MMFAYVCAATAGCLRAQLEEMFQQAQEHSAALSKQKIADGARIQGKVFLTIAFKLIAFVQSK